MKKKSNASQKSLWDFLKDGRRNLGQKYRNTGKPIKIIDVNKEDGGFTLEDYSQWKPDSFFRARIYYWSRGDEVIVTASQGGWRMELYNVRNISLDDESLCTFHGFLEES